MGLQEHRDESPVCIAFAVLTISDSRDRGSDRGGDYLVEAIEAAGHRVVERSLCPDEGALIATSVRAAAERADIDLVLTTGGTGIAPRDVTFTALGEVLDSELPGFGELFRWLSYAEIGSAAILSRALGGLVGDTVVLAMPGSPKALRLAMEKIVLPEAGHLVSQSRRR
ncbi:MAG: molybdenum cofactor biosynthesis protein [Planctomycetes bacterium]|jgi:molybdenum cofactor biosynthesis protein B|nr:molybdenum cofactor biosynthesis protein [Planctomycetota bacterium]MDP6408089.1 molybdenum cofactor biosynthesis protein B [Planctomycetota bacterium]